MMGLLRTRIHSQSDRLARIALNCCQIIAFGIVMSLSACRPAPSQVGRVAWQHDSPPVQGLTLDEFIVTPLAVDGDGDLWFGHQNLHGDGGVGQLVSGAAGEQMWEMHPALPNDRGPETSFVLALVPDGRGGIWVGTVHGGLSHYDGEAHSWKMIKAPIHDVFAIVPDSVGLWLATFGGGVVHYETGSQEWTAYTKATTAGGIQDDQVIELIPDGAGGLWAGTYGGGVSHYDPESDSWRAIAGPSTEGGLGSEDVRALLVGESGDLWIGTFGGGISHYDPRRNAWELYTVETTSRGLASNYVLTLLPDGNAGLWAGLSNLRGQGGLAYFDGKAWQSHTVASTGGGLLSDDVRAIAPDGTGGLWVGTQGGGLSHLSADRQTWTVYTADSTGGGLAGDSVLALQRDGDGGMWVGTASGLSHVSWRAP